MASSRTSISYPSLDRDDRYHAALAAATWWQSDPTAAMAWINRSVDDAGLVVQMRTAIVNMAAITGDLPTAFEMLEKLPANDELPSVLATISAKAILSDPVGTIDWLANFEDPGATEVAARQAAGELAQLDPAACIEHFDSLASMLTRPEGNHFGYQLWDELIPHLLSHGSGAATDWIDGLPVPLKADALKSLARTGRPAIRRPRRTTSPAKRTANLRSRQARRSSGSGRATIPLAPPTGRQDSLRGRTVNSCLRILRVTGLLPIQPPPQSGSRVSRPQALATRRSSPLRATPRSRIRRPRCRWRARSPTRTTCRSDCRNAHQLAPHRSGHRPGGLAEPALARG